LNDKLTALFKPCHARQYGGISFEIRLIGGSVATSKKLNCYEPSILNFFNAHNGIIVKLLKSEAHGKK